MSAITIKKCDRCGQFCADEETFATVAIVTASADLGAAVQKQELDLCEGCEAGLAAYLGGSKLARTRAPK